MIWRNTHRLCGAIIVLSLSACAGWFAKKPDADAAATEAATPSILGRVASKPGGQNFVLIQSYTSTKPQSGAILTTLGPGGRTANLLATGETLGQFSAADIQSGDVEIGDAVYLRLPPARPATPEKPETEAQDAENQEPAEAENVQKNN